MFKVNNKKTRMTSMPKWDFNEVAKQLYCLSFLTRYMSLLF